MAKVLFINGNKQFIEVRKENLKMLKDYDAELYSYEKLYFDEMFALAVDLSCIDKYEETFHYCAESFKFREKKAEEPLVCI